MNFVLALCAVFCLTLGFGYGLGGLMSGRSNWFATTPVALSFAAAWFCHLLHNQISGAPLHDKVWDMLFIVFWLYTAWKRRKPRDKKRSLKTLGAKSWALIQKLVASLKPSLPVRGPLPQPV